MDHRDYLNLIKRIEEIENKMNLAFGKIDMLTSIIALKEITNEGHNVSETERKLRINELLLELFILSEK